MSFSLKKAEIFALLGHNGAGKTTMIKQLTGFIPVTSGDATMATLPNAPVAEGVARVSRDIAEVRRYALSVCPQDNPHWAAFTAREHLEFFAECRLGQDPTFGHAAVEEQILRYTEILGLSAKLDTPCKVLSGGQKRRLWVICSLLGQAPLILMDEPTSGMDPQARRDFWVSRQREGKRPGGESGPWCSRLGHLFSRWTISRDAAGAGSVGDTEKSLRIHTGVVDRVSLLAQFISV